MRSEFDIVHPALLVPPDSPIRSGSRTNAALVLDRELVRLAGMDARCRLVQARIVRRLMDTRGWRPLGFVRLSDYARERPGCSARMLQEDAHVLRVLDGLPAMRSAFERGDLSWSQTRLLVRVATPENETSIVERTAGLTTRHIQDLLPGLASPAVAGSGAGDERTGPDCTERASIAAPGSDCVDDCADEPLTRLDVPVSPRGRRLWNAASEIARRATGGPLSSAQVLELVVAEAASGEPARANDDLRWAPTADDQEAKIRARLAYEESRGRSFVEAFLAETGVAEGFAWLESARLEPGPAQRLDALLDSLDDADAHELDRRLREVRRASQRIDYQLATLLRIGDDRRLFREIGFATFKLYVETRLGVSSRRVWSMIAIERRSWQRCKLLREAWRDGRISYLAACTLLPVISENHGEAWIRRAGEVTLRRLADEVAWALDDGERDSLSSLPAPPPAGAIVPAGGVPSVDLHEVQMRAHGEDARDGWRCPGGRRLTLRVPVPVAALFEVQLDRYRQAREERWRTFERLVALAILEWTSVPRHRDPVFERDGWRCSVPGCSSRRNLHDHHVVFRSHGGDNSRDNRITVCAAHHLHGIHEGIVTAEGTAPYDIDWALGCAAGRRPVLRTHGERHAA